MSESATLEPPEDRWEPWPPNVVALDGPSRIYDDNPPTDAPRPVGFTPPPRPEEVTDMEPLTASCPACGTTFAVGGAR